MWFNKSRGEVAPILNHIEHRAHRFHIEGCLGMVAVLIGGMKYRSGRKIESIS